MSYYDSLEALYTGELIRKDLSHERYALDPYIVMRIERNRCGIRRIIWNMLVSHIMKHYKGILADMLFVAYRVGINDGRANDLH